MAPWSALAGGALIVSSLERGGLLSRSHDLEDFLDHFPRVMALHRFAQSLLDPIDDVALGLERFALGVQLNVGFLELGDRDPYLLLHRRQSLRGRPRLDRGDLDRPLQLSDPYRITGSLP